LSRSKVLEKRQTNKRSSNNNKQKTDHITSKLIPSTRTSSKRRENENGIAKLILTIIKILTDLLERQAQRKVMEGNLKETDVEHLGSAFINIRQTLYDISRQYGFEENDLQLPVYSTSGSSDENKSKDGKLLSTTTLVDILDELINKKTVVAGEITISVAEIDLIVLRLLAELSSKDGRTNKSNFGYNN